MKKRLCFVLLLGLIWAPRNLLCDENEFVANEFVTQYKSDSNLEVSVDGGHASHGDYCGADRPSVDGVNGCFYLRALYDQWNSRAHSFFEIPPYIGPGNSYSFDGNNSYIQKLSKYEYRDGKIILRDPENLIKTFCREMGEKTLGIRVDW